MSTELYKRYRPKTFKEIVGQQAAVGMLYQMCKSNTVPHTVLLSGPSGCGKTTLARIMARQLKCSKHDFQEINAADFRGIDKVREIRESMPLSPLGGKCRIWLIDESHQLSSQAQNAFLKLLEDTPNHVYFMLATTQPEKLLKTIKTRCSEVKLGLLSVKEIEGLIQAVAQQEDREIASAVVDKIVEVAEGSARMALVLLGQAFTTDDPVKQIQLVEDADIKRQAIELARMLINPRSKWEQVAALLESLNEDPETLRWMVLGYASKVMLGGSKVADRAYHVVSCFSDNFYDSKKAGLVLACYDVINAGKR